VGAQQTSNSFSKIFKNETHSVSGIIGNPALAVGCPPINNYQAREPTKPLKAQGSNQAPFIFKSKGFGIFSPSFHKKK
jgi:hypothetical protein